MSNNTLMFPGSGDVYVKYHDIIGTPRFSVLVKLIRNQLHPGLYETSFFQRISKQDLVQWYLARTKENFLDIDMINVHGFTPDENDRILQQMLKEVPYATFAPVNLMSAVVLHPIIERLHVYSYHEERAIEYAIAPMRYNVPSVDYRFGDFSDIINDAKDHATLITTSTAEARAFLKSEHKHRYIALIYPNMYDSIRSISDVYSSYSDRISIIDLSNRIKIWEESIS